MDTLLEQKSNLSFPYFLILTDSHARSLLLAGAHGKPWKKAASGSKVGIIEIPSIQNYMCMGRSHQLACFILS